MGEGDYYVFGAGGFGRELAQLIHDLGDSGPARFLGFIDDNPTPSAAALGWGTVRAGTALDDLAGASFVVGIGSPEKRESVTSRLEMIGLRTGPPLTHPSAWVGRFVDIGDGSAICAGSVITTNISIGAHVHINLNCTIGHDAILEDFVTLSPGALVSGGVHIGRGAELGTGAKVLPGVTIGERAFVGAGAVATKDVGDDEVVVGIPAKPLRRR